MSVERKRKHQEREGGIALLTVLFALLLISGIAMGMMFMANTETVINTNFRDMQKAQYGAWSGVHEARGRMINNTSPFVLPTTLPTSSASTGVFYVLNPASGETVDPSGTVSGGLYPDTELCHEGYPGLGLTDTGNNVPCSGTSSLPSTTSYGSTTSLAPGEGTNYAVPYKWARITIKNNKAAGGDSSSTYQVHASGSNTTPVCFNGTRQILLSDLPGSGGVTKCENYTSTNPNDSRVTSVYVVTSLGVTSTGARRMVQMETAFNPPLITNSAVVANDNVTTSGSSTTIVGYDNCDCTCTTAKGKSLPTCTTNSDGSACTAGGYSMKLSSPHTESGTAGLTAPQTPNVTQVGTFPYDVAGLIATYSGSAVTSSQVTCVGTSCSASGASFGTVPSTFPPVGDCGTACTYQTTYVNGDLDLTNHCQGAGVLMVNGNLTVHGGLDFYGLILVTGSVTFVGGGSGQDSNVIGSIISGGSTNADAIGGGIQIQYDSCALAHTFTGAAPAVLASRELPY